MPEVEIRSFQRRDQVAAQALILAGLGEHFDTLDPTLNPDIDDIWTNYAARGNWFLVAIGRNTVVGTGALVRETAGTGRIVRMSVSATQRQKGIARRLTQDLIAIGRGAGFGKIVVETNDDWQPAIQLYESCGFTPYDHRKGEIHMVLHLINNS